MTDKEIAVLLGKKKGFEPKKLLQEGNRPLALMNTVLVKGYLTGEKEKLKLTSGIPKTPG